MSLSKQKFFLPLLTFIIIGSLAFGVLYTVSKDTQKPASSESAQGTKQNPYQVSLKKENKEPVDLLIKKGEYVQFNSSDGEDHQIIQGASTNEEHGPTEHVPSPLDSGLIKSDEGYLLQFKETGKYDFHDNYDHDYTISVLVYDPAVKSSAPEIQ